MDSSSKLSLDDLLTHAAWARELATALIADPAGAEDLVQETWVAAMRRPPSNEASTRPWLARVMRNLARNRWRGEARRGQRELAAARDEALPGSDEVAAELEMQRALVDALGEIDEPLRDTVVRRYFHNMSSADIAEAERLPESTVRNRLKRGLDALRAKLDRKYGDRSAWAVLLAPLATRHAAPTATIPAAGAAGFAGGMTMAAMMKMASAALVVVAAAIWIWKGDLADSRSSPHAEREATSVSLAQSDDVQVAAVADSHQRTAIAPASSSSPSQASVGAQASVADEDAHAILEARVVDSMGVPIAGAELIVVERVGEIERSQAPRATSGPDGKVRLEVGTSDRNMHRGRARVLARDEWTMQIEISAPGSELHADHPKVKAGQTTFLGDIRLGPGGSLRGRIVTQDGSPLPKIGVSIVEPTVTLEERVRADGLNRAKGVGGAELSKENGSYERAGLPIGTYRVTTGHVDGWLGAFSEPIEVRAGELSTVPDLVLRRNPFVIRGTVRRSDGSPAVSEHVEYLFSHHADGSASWVGESTDKDGRFMLDFPVETTVDLYLCSADEQAGVANVRGESLIRGVSTGKDDLEVRLPEPSWMELLVLDKQGIPSPWFEVGVRFADQAGISDATGRAHPDGRARVLVRARAFFLEINGKGTPPHEEGPFDLEHHPQSLVISLEDPSPPLRVHVTANGKPVAGAHVELHPVIDPNLNSKMAYNGFPSHVGHPLDEQVDQTDDQGRTTIVCREKGRLSFVVGAAGFADAETAPFENDPAIAQAEFEVVLTGGGALAGRVITSAERSPAGILVGTSRGDGACRVVRADETGKFHFERLGAGTWTVRRCDRDYVASGSFNYGEVAGFDPFMQSGEVVEGRTTQVDLDLSDVVCAVEGKLSISDSTPRKWTSALTASGADEREAVPATVQADGTFRVDASILGEHRLVIADSGDGDRDQRIEAKLDIQRGINRWQLSFATGTLDGESLPGAMLAHTWTGTQGAQCTTRFIADAHGHFRVTCIPVGRGRIERLLPKSGVPPFIVDVPKNAVLNVTVP